MPESTLIAAALDDRYVIERELGSGGMAIVYLARDRKLDRDVALKVLRPELGAVLGAERFLSEIKISARLDHPHILTLIDSGEANGFLYYVLPYVRGESLRDKLDRERQLGIEEAIVITRQVASAIDYAHRQGLVHRDIKPENILIQEGEAMLADFGIALAVKEAGGNRLTQTGLSLGTPQYMSPEQATGDRGIDARSDVYSLAAVLYEMLAGEPPVTGASAQSMIAKLMTENPTHLRVLRDTVSPELDAAVAKALAKTPADRFNSASEFAKALDAKPSVQVASPSRSRARAGAMVAGIAVIALVSAAAWRYGHREVPVTLGGKTQITSTGNVLMPAISPDGKQLAYVTRDCKGSRCTFAVNVQDVGGSTTRTIMDGATASNGLEWSPDRRNLLFTGTVAGHAGVHLVSALGGAPRYVSASVATFFAGGDSLLLGPVFHPDSAFWIRVAGLDGVTHDSIHVAGPGQLLGAITAVPGTNWIVTLVVQPPKGLWQVMDRSGKVVDHVVNACTCGGVATSDAVWLSRAGDGLEESVVRIGLDRANGHLATRQDTMAHGLFTQFSLTADGASMVMDEGTFQHSVWAVPFADAIKGDLPDAARIARSSSAVSASMSPDGGRLLLRRIVPVSGGMNEVRYSVMPFAGGAEVPLAATGAPVRAVWRDSTSVSVLTKIPSGRRLAVVDVRNGAQSNALDLPDPVYDFAALAKGWAWIPITNDKIIVTENGRRAEHAMPAWFGGIFGLVADDSARRVVYYGFGRATGDSAGVGALSLDGGAQELWAARFGEQARVFATRGHGALLGVMESQDAWTLYAVDGPGKVAPLGTLGRPLLSFSPSGDLKRIVVTERDYRADAWLNRVVTRP
ncbi:MAG: hypothetical protein JWO05_3915 [Gemmatimonadetes bacterium]|nr:hypothetical protein [Gemmatimonadota bacterium]